jgi:hypothetical protein
VAAPTVLARMATHDATFNEDPRPAAGARGALGR